MTTELSRASKWSGGRCVQVIPFLMAMIFKPIIVDLVIFKKEEEFKMPPYKHILRQPLFGRQDIYGFFAYRNIFIPPQCLDNNKGFLYNVVLSRALQTLKYYSLQLCKCCSKLMVELWLYIIFSLIYIAVYYKINKA